MAEYRNPVIPFDGLLKEGELSLMFFRVGFDLWVKLH
jgi:hypothetical protein